MQVSITRITVVLLLFSCSVPLSADTLIEVDVNGTFTPLDKAVVPTANPTIRITRDVDVPADFSVLLTRDDNRAGIGGAGKSISVDGPGSGADLEETGVGTEVYEGSIEVLTGVNTIRIQPNGGGPDLLVATMLNYSLAFEDMNGNGVLDTGEDADHDGELDLGEDIDGDNELDLDEDFNLNGVLDAIEDVNGNEFLDFNEDLNGNGLLTVNEDFDNSGMLDPGEDFDMNGGISEYSLGVAAEVSLDPPDLGTITETGMTYALQAIRLDFIDAATDLQISDYLRTHDLKPLGITLDNSLSPKAKLVTVEVPMGQDALDLVKQLDGLPLAGFDFFPDTANLPVDSPLEVAVLILTAPRSDTLGEALPARLLNGAAAPPSGGNAGDGYEAVGTNGGFDNDNDGGGNDFDELNIFWHHFFMQTFAAHRLIDNLVPTNPAPQRPLVAHVDSGIGGGGVGPAYVPAGDVPAGRIIRPSNCTVAGCPVVAVNRIPDTVGHGNQVAHLLGGQGTRVLGVGKDLSIRPMFGGRLSSPVNDGRGVAAAAADAAVSVILLESQERDLDLTNDGAVTSVLFGGVNELRNAVQTLNTNEVSWRPAVNAVVRAANTKIVIIPAGNHNHDTSFTLLGGPMVTAQGNLRSLFNVPPRGTRAAGNANALIVGVSNSTAANLPRGPEQRSVFSNAGTRISVAGTGCGVPSLAPNQNFGPFGGTSGAAPQVAGLAGELLYLDTNLANVGPFTPLQIIQFMEGTADDLGSTSAAAPFVNNDAGNGSDNQFGYGRINAWKAVLSAINGGLSEQHGRTAGGGGNDSVFQTLPLVDDGDTDWYGFEIVTSERHATVWIDGTQLADAGATIPNAPNITAYKGIRSDLRIERGVHNLTDGSADDPTVAGPPARPGQVVEEDPTTGIVPVGTRINDRGQYVMTFSIERSDLFELANDGTPDTSKPRTLSIRRRGKPVSDRPIFNLRLETTKMRTGEVTGVTFDDFVFTVTPPDYGDAAINPTLLSENGARHENSNFEWLGRLNAPNIKSVTPEHNADKDDTKGGDAEVDVDGVDNRHDFHDRDGRDDGVLFFPLTYKTAAGNPGVVEFTIGVADAGSPRFSAADPDKSLFVNLWIDWNASGTWAEINSEHVLDGVRIKPVAGGGAWQVTHQGSSGSVTAHVQNGADNNSAKFRSQIPVGIIGKGLIWARMRLDYGENVGRNDPLPQFESLRSMRSAAGTPGLTKGAARYGEVEDYLVGSDFGDAPDPFTAPGSYPTKKVNAGARHLDMHKEWLGPDNNVRPQATREIDANDGITDEDIIINLVNRDKLCDGVVIPPIVPGEIIDIEVTVTSSISARGAGLAAAADEQNVSCFEDAADSLPRYGFVEPLRRLYLSGWADWNDCDGNWVPAEKIIDDIIFPDLFGADGQYTLGEPYTDTNQNGVCDNNEPFTDFFGVDTKTFIYSVQVPPAVCCPFYFRFRLAYGEDEATVDLEVKEADEDGRLNVEEKGGALMGEVEDYPATIYKVWDYIYTPLQDTVFSPSVWTEDGVPIGETFPASEYPNGITPIPTIPLTDHRIVPAPPNDWHWDVTYTPPGQNEKQFIVWLDRFDMADLLCVEVVCPPPFITSPVMLMANVEEDTYQLTDDFGVIHTGPWSQYPHDIPLSLGFQPTGIVRCNIMPCDCPGDVDGSGFVDTDDIIPFVEELLIVSMNDCADTNGDNHVSGLDIQPFVDLVLADNGSGTECTFPPRGACCLSPTDCVDGVTIKGCFALQGIYMGDDTDCLSVNCVEGASVARGE